MSPPMRLRTILFVALVAAALIGPTAAPPALAQSELETTPVATPVASTPAASAPDAADRPADSASYCGRRLGQWFYCERPAAAPDAQPTHDGPEVEPPREIAELEAYQKALDEAGKVASWNPTSENVERYMRLQRIALDKSGLFTDLWRRAVWNNPDLDYTLQRPTSAVAKTEYMDERQSDRDVFLRSVSAQVGVFYIYSGTCGPCRVASPIIKEFADRYGVTVKVISTDTPTNPVFGSALVDHGQLKAWGIERTVTPALLIFQAPTPTDQDGAPRRQVVASVEGREMTLRPCQQPRGCLTYLGAGVMSVEDIAERLFVLLSKDPGTDY